MRTSTTDRITETTSLDDVLDDYAYSPSIWSTDDDRTRRAKWIVSTRLATHERNILLLYAEHNSLREVADILQCSHTLVAAELKKIRKKIMLYYTNDETPD